MQSMLRCLLASLAALMMTGLAVVGGSALTASSASAACYPTGSSTCASLTTSSNSVPPGGSCTLTGAGYAPGTQVTINVCNLETLTVTADSSGDFSQQITIPSNAQPGTCAITAT